MRGTRTPVLLSSLLLLVLAGAAAPVASAVPVGPERAGAAPPSTISVRELPVGPPPRVPHLVGGSIDDGYLAGRDLVDGDVRIPVPGAADLVGRSGTGYVVLSGSDLLRVAPGAAPLRLARGVAGVRTSSDGRLAAVEGFGGYANRLRVVDTRDGDVVAEHRFGTTSVSVLAVRGRTVLVGAYRRTAPRSTTLAWDTRSGRVRQVAAFDPVLTDAAGQVGVRWTQRRSVPCQEVRPQARPEQLIWRTCGAYAGIEAFGPGGEMLAYPAPGGGLALRTARGRLLATYRLLAPQDVQNRLVGTTGGYSDSRWEAPGVVLLGVDARPRGTPTPVPGIARCTTTACEWAGEPQPLG